MHADGCSRCAALLADQRALNAILKITSVDGNQAPGRVEAALIAAYRLRQARVTRNGIPLPVNRRRTVQFRGIAASLLVALLGLTALLMMHIQQPDKVSGISEHKLQYDGFARDTPPEFCF